MGSQRVGHDWAAELTSIEDKWHWKWETRVPLLIVRCSPWYRLWLQNQKHFTGPAGTIAAAVPQGGWSSGWSESGTPLARVCSDEQSLLPTVPAYWLPVGCWEQTLRSSLCGNSHFLMQQGKFSSGSGLPWGAKIEITSVWRQSPQSLPHQCPPHVPSIREVGYRRPAGGKQAIRDSHIYQWVVSAQGKRSRLGLGISTFCSCLGFKGNTWPPKFNREKCQLWELLQAAFCLWTHMPFSENPLWYAFHPSAFFVSLFFGPLEILREVSSIDRFLNDVAEMSCCTAYTGDNVGCFPSVPFLQVKCR